MRELKNGKDYNASYDEYNRLIRYIGKLEVTCPTQMKSTAVLLALGQSNIANSAKKKLVTKYPNKVVNYFNGKCFIASSPMLGASGNKGEFLTPLADKLIEDGTYKSVVIISSGIGAKQVREWQRGGVLNNMLMEVINDLKNKYKITEIIWHQGEIDFLLQTSANDYVKSFKSLLDTIRENNVAAKVFIAISTKCGFGPWTKDNPTSNAQKQLVDNKQVFLGADTDAILSVFDRRKDYCHLSQSGQLKTASAFASSIQKYH